MTSDEIYRQLIRAVIARNPRISCEPDEQIVIPGFAGLREFSRAQEKNLKAACGGAWRSYFLRSHWRMISPFSRAHQSRTAGSLVAALQKKSPADFPSGEISVADDQSLHRFVRRERNRARLGI